MYGSSSRWVTFSSVETISHGAADLQFPAARSTGRCQRAAAVACSTRTPRHWMWVRSPTNRVAARRNAESPARRRRSLVLQRRLVATGVSATRLPGLTLARKLQRMALVRCRRGGGERTDGDKKRDRWQERHSTA